MNWKEFLKPSWKKIILWIVIGIVLNIVTLFSLVLIGSEAVMINYAPFFRYGLLIISYLISCLIVSKVNKK